jgi:hypothetical protein
VLRRALDLAAGACVVVLAAGCASGAATSGAASGPAAPPPGQTQPATTHPAHRHHRRQHHPAHRHHRRPRRSRRDAGVPAADLPNHRLTPGVALSASAARVCVRGYSASVRDVPQAEKDAVYARYGVVDVPYRHEVDHLVSLEIGGSNAIANLWPEPYAGRWGARTKDVLENRLHELVCDGRLRLRRAQRIEAADWVAAYRRYVGGTPIAAGSGVGAGGGATAGGYYASAYPTSSTIYCADDAEWRGLSSRYLLHFRTLAQARARFPGYHLHRPC